MSDALNTLDRGEIGYLSVIAHVLSAGSLLSALIGPRTVQMGVVVYGNVSTTAIDGIVLAVQATVGGLTGHKDIVPNGVAPAAGQCSIAVDATTGRSVVTFAGADAVTECTVEMLATGTAYRALLSTVKG